MLELKVASGLDKQTPGLQVFDCTADHGCRVDGLRECELGEYIKEPTTPWVVVPVMNDDSARRRNRNGPVVGRQTLLEYLKSLLRLKTCEEAQSDKLFLGHAPT